MGNIAMFMNHGDNNDDEFSNCQYKTAVWEEREGI